MFVGPQAAQPVEACRSVRGFALLENLLQPDGRINQVAHFGGDSLYCVDANGSPTNDYAALAAFRVLDISGQDLWELSAEEVAASLAALDATGEDQIIGTGAGSYGTATLRLLANEGGTPSFQFAAYDEYGKLNTLEFQGCGPVGPSAPTTTQSSAPSPVCYEYTFCTFERIECEAATTPCELDIYDYNENDSTTDYVCGVK
jgi:hypothetical protein